MVNIERLKTALKSRGVTIEQASERIGVNPATFYRRISQDGKNFTVAEVGMLVNLLGLDAKDMQAIFFEK